MIERVALALCVHDVDLGNLSKEQYWNCRPRYLRQRFINEARIVLEAICEPDSQMVAAGRTALSSRNEQKAKNVWRAMLNAALEEVP